jgi:hypothetical protein
MMRYLTLIADYTQSPLRDDFVGTVVPEEIGLPWELGDRLRDWNGRYRAVIPIDVAERARGPVSELIDELDEEGLRLAAEIASALDEVKVRYYSEGRLRYVS